jgi:hypothetical protein
MEMSLPFGVLDQALAALGGPALLTGSDAAIARPGQLYRLLRWLERSERGMLIAIDDLHWADSDSLDILSLLCRRIGSPPAAVVATMRAWPEEARDVASRLFDAGVAQQVRLAPLSREGSTAMLVERAGREVSEAAATKAWELCAGNPLLLEQVASAIRTGRRVELAVAMSEDVWAIAARGICGGLAVTRDSPNGIAPNAQVRGRCLDHCIHKEGPMRACSRSSLAVLRSRHSGRTVLGVGRPEWVGFSPALSVRAPEGLAGHRRRRCRHQCSESRIRAFAARQ